MENNNFNGERYSPNNKENNNNFNTGGIRDIDVPQRNYLQENKFKEINLEKRKMSFWKKIIFFSIILGVIGFLISFFFHSASFEVKNSVKDIKFTNDILKANIIETKTGEEMSFKLLNFDVVLEKDIKSEMVEDVKEKAVGKIKIINNTSKLQKLRKETRFEVNGKIFKTYKSVSIPAKSSLVREAFADLEGEEYNLKKGLKMTIPGFKEGGDMDSYKKIVGEIAEDFTGGFVGKKDIPDKEDFERKKKILSDEVESTVLIKARTKLPKDSILNTDGIFTEINYKTENKDGNLKLIAIANVKAVIFDKKDFLSVVSGLIKSKIEKYNINSTAFLKFKILEKEKISIDSLKNFTFELNGELKYNRIFDKDEFINLARGKNKKELQQLLDNNFKDFSIDTKIFPFWMNSIPLEKEKVSVKVIEE